MNNSEERDGSFSLEDWAAHPIEYWDAEPGYTAELKPMIEAIMAKCVELGVPYAMRFTVKSEADGHTDSSHSWLGGIGRATAELLAISMCHDVDRDYLESAEAICYAAYEKLIRHELKGELK